MCVCYHCASRKQRNELKVGTLTVSRGGFLQRLEALAAMRIMGVANENVRWTEQGGLCTVIFLVACLVSIDSSQ